MPEKYAPGGQQEGLSLPVIGGLHQTGDIHLGTQLRQRDLRFPLEFLTAALRSGLIIIEVHRDLQLRQGGLHSLCARINRHAADILSQDIGTLPERAALRGVDAQTQIGGRQNRQQNPDDDQRLPPALLHPGAALLLYRCLPDLFHDALPQLCQ